jgi:peptidyl-tRNA hydrolase, PTH2 family
MREVKQYIIVRTDLPMNAGKLAAQAAHASMKVFFDKMKFSEKTSVIPFYPGTSDEEGIAGDYSFKVTHEEQRWIEGNFTKITKKVKNENQLLKVYQAAKDAGLNASLIKDAGLYGLEGENYTCIAVGPNYVEDCEPIVGKLQLLTDLKNHESKE